MSTRSQLQRFVPLLTLTLALWAGSGAQLSAQPTDFVEFQGHWYGLTSAAMNWHDAEAEAVVLGGNLVAITSAAEQEFLVGTFLQWALAEQPLWMGLNDEDVEGTYVWTNGDAFSFTNWEPGEPNGGTFENYGCFNWHHSSISFGEELGTWNDCPADGFDFGPYFGLIELEFDPNLPPRPELLPNEIYTFGGSFYFFTAFGRSWPEQELVANQQGGHLVAINSAAEQAFLESTLLEGVMAIQPIFFGINDIEVEGTFVWSSGDPVTYTNWEPGEPSDSGGEDWGCLNWHNFWLFSSAPEGTWNDCSELTNYFGIIETPIDPRLFADGFESGDTTVWSGTNP